MPFYLRMCAVKFNKDHSKKFMLMLRIKKKRNFGTLKVGKEVCIQIKHKHQGKMKYLLNFSENI